jgi:hypothetical protein
VVVDFRAFDGGISVACAPGDPGSGVDALSNAGFGVTGTSRWGLAFVCRINGKPDTDPCINTPPTNAYWSYWHASRGGSWSYSGLGASVYDPPVGSVEGWSFGSGGAPGIAPPAAPAPPPADPPAPPPPAGGGSGGGDGGSGGSGGAGTGGGAGEPTAGPESTVDASPSATASSSAPVGGSASSPATSLHLTDPPAAAPSRPTGGVTGTLTGVGLIAVIAAAAAVIGLRRRSRARPAGAAPPLDGPSDGPPEAPRDGDAG